MDGKRVEGGFLKERFKNLVSNTMRREPFFLDTKNIPKFGKTDHIKFK